VNGTSIDEELTAAAVKHGFGGAIGVDRRDEPPIRLAFGLSDRAHGVATTPTTRFAMASGSKAFTALAVMRLVEDGVLSLDTRVREVLGGDLALIDDAVTVEHLLANRSGIGDYLDEGILDDVDAYLLRRPAHVFDDVERFVAELDGFPQVFPPGERFAYNNGGFVVLSIVAQRASGELFHDLVERTVLAPAGMTRSGFLRSDQLPGDAALGYLQNSDRTNVLHLPVRGGGDGGAYTCLDDMAGFWRALTAGAIVPAERVAEMLRPHSDVPENHMRYGLGFWLPVRGWALLLVGEDAGVSFSSAHDPESQSTATVLANTSSGAWPIARVLREQLQGFEKTAAP
jgi:CubicO group peptidase (beta-lactamase class C family)